MEEDERFSLELPDSEADVSTGSVPMPPPSTVTAEGASAAPEPPTAPTTFASSPMSTTAEGLSDVLRAVGGVLDDIAMSDSEDTAAEGTALHIFSANAG